MRRRLLGNRRSGEIIGSTTPTDALLASYEMNGNANDSFGTFNGTGANIIYSSGDLGGQADFNGTTSHITIPNDIYVNPTVFSISLFIKAASQSTICRVLTLNGNTGAPYVSFRFNEGGTNRFTAVVNNTEGFAIQFDLTTIGALVTNWNHYLIRVNNSETSQLFVNNQNSGTETHNITKTFNYNRFTSDNRNLIGAARNFSARFSGSVTKMNLYNKYVTDQERATLYNGGTGTTL